MSAPARTLDAPSTVLPAPHLEAAVLIAAAAVVVAALVVTGPPAVELAEMLAGVVLIGP